MCLSMTTRAQQKWRCLTIWGFVCRAFGEPAARDAPGDLDRDAGLDAVLGVSNLFAAAGDAADEVCDVFGVTAAGNWEGVNVLTLRAERPRTARFEAASAALRSAEASACSIKINK